MPASLISLVSIGYGCTGRTAAHTLRPVWPAMAWTVIDTDPARTGLAASDGARTVTGDGLDPAALRVAGVAAALAVVIAAGDDTASVRIVSAVRALAPHAKVSVALRHGMWEDAARYRGANQVVVTAELTGRMLARPVRTSGLARWLFDAAGKYTARQQLRHAQRKHH